MNAAGLRGARPAAPCPRASGAPAGPRAAAPAQRAGAAGRSIARRCGAADPRAPFRRVRPGWWGPWALRGGAQTGRLRVPPARVPPGPAGWGRWHGALRAPGMRMQGTSDPASRLTSAPSAAPSAETSQENVRCQGEPASSQPHSEALSCRTF